MKLAQMLALAMLLGSIPFGYIAVHLRKPGAARDSGASVESIRRAVGLPGLIAVVVLNAAKGFMPVYLAKGAIPSLPILAVVGLIAVLSHCFPYWFMFRPSGKGGSVAVGAALALLI